MSRLMEAPQLETERLILRGHVMSDFEPLYQLLESDRAEFMDGPHSRKDSWFWIASEVGSWVLKGFGSWGVERRDDGAFLGQIGINQPEGYPEPEMGWVFLETAEGKGYASEAGAAVLTWARANPNLLSLVSYIDRRNDRSITLAQRLAAIEDQSATLPTWERTQDTAVYRHSLGGAA